MLRAWCKESLLTLFGLHYTGSFCCSQPDLHWVYYYIMYLCYIEKLESHINLLLLGLLNIIEAFVICSSLPLLAKQMIGSSWRRCFKRHICSPLEFGHMFKWRMKPRDAISCKTVCFCFSIMNYPYCKIILVWIQWFESWV